MEGGMMGSSSAFPIVIPDDEEEVVPGGAEEEQPAAAAAGGEEEEEEEEEGKYKRPGWLPDGFEAEGYYEDDGTFQATVCIPFVSFSFICPVTGFRFGLKSEVLHYCSSGAMDRAQAGKNTLDDSTTLQFYAHLSRGLRLRSKEQVMRYVDKVELPDVACIQIIAQLEFHARSLPPGWVKETAFRKCNDGIRKDVFYTDPITGKVFRLLKTVQQYFESGKPLGGRVPTMSVTDMYYFDRCTDMVISTIILCNGILAPIYFMVFAIL
ncbi:hypothetical protein HU200_006821 [Digitaria exilis]|uniref:MBD domain-containing protein n=1 Tax=Digitaria exilis TaxID=1010633 RepID=A0A835FPG6_9POAL|nr:hypothetical protein HU200_006821 [Digitaria exilis]